MATATGNDRSQRGGESRRDVTAGQDATRSGQTTAGQAEPAQRGMTQGSQGALRGAMQRGTSPGGMGRGGLAPLGGLGLGATSPFGIMRRFMEDMDQMFSSFGGPGLLRADSPLGGGGGLWQPQIEVFERDGNLVVRADLPGIERDAVQLRVEDDVLYVSGERRDERKEEREGWYHSERSYGSFQRAVQLPPGIDPDRIDASFTDGVLEVKVPVPQGQTRGRSIAIGERSGGVQAAGGVGGSSSGKSRETQGEGSAQSTAAGDASAKARGLS